MKLFAPDVAIEVAKTLLSSDQRELIFEAGKRKMKTVDAVAEVSFDFADAFLKEFNKRYEK